MVSKKKCPDDNDLFNYDKIDVAAVTLVIEKCFAKNKQGKMDPIAISVLDITSTLMRELVAPVQQRQKIFLAAFGGLSIGLALVMVLINWPHVLYPTLTMVIGLLTIAAIAQTISKLIFRTKVQRVIIGANSRGVVLEWLVEQRPDLRYILDDLSAAGLPIRQVVRRFITNRPADAVPPEIVAKMRADMNARRQELIFGTKETP